MPNLVEQAELVKRLTNDQLAVVMQNPTGAIPPFIFAAEAARRQAIQEQFSGGPKESVVDTLTKQMAKVPQNIQSGKMTTPPVPPTPQMQGVMALQQQQAMQQAAQQAMPQGMRAGGPVRRFQSAGFVAPVPPVNSRIQEIADQFGYTVEEAAEALKNNPSLAGGATEERTGRPFTILDQPAPGSQPAEPLASEDTRLFGMTPYDYLKMGAGFFAPSSLFGLDPLTAYKQRQEDDKRAETEKRAEASMLQGDEAFQDYAAQARRLVRPEQLRRIAPRNETAGQENTSTENKSAAEEAALKKRLEELYGQTELSDWEKAQKWFAASQQFLQPDQTLMQSLVGAGAAFSEGAAEEQRAKRLADIELKKALYELDVAKRGEERNARAARLKARTDIATGQLDDIRREMQVVSNRMQQVRDDAIKFNLPPEQVKTEIDRLQGQYDDLGAQLGTYQKFLEENYDFPIIPVVDTATRTIRTPT